MDTPSDQIGPSADIWSLAMVVSEICNGEVPFDTQECRNMSLQNFIEYLRSGVRPNLIKDFASYKWLLDMVSNMDVSLYCYMIYTPLLNHCL